MYYYYCYYYYVWTMSESLRWCEDPPVHLSQQLVDGLSGVGVHGGLNPLSPHTVQLIDEDHTRGACLRLLCREQGHQSGYYQTASLLRLQ